MELSYADIALLNCNTFFDPYRIPAMLALVDEPRRKKVMSWSTERDQRLSLGVGLLARFLMLRRGICPDMLAFDLDGRPTITGAFLSLSHASQYAMAGLSSAPIGVDVEQHQPEQLNIADHFFTETERRQVAGDLDPVGRFFRIWSRKECIIKRDGLRDLRDLQTEFPMYQECFHDVPLTGYSCVCYVEKGITPQIEMLDWNKLMNNLENP